MMACAVGTPTTFMTDGFMMRMRSIVVPSNA